MQDVKGKDMCVSGGGACLYVGGWGPCGCVGAVFDEMKLNDINKMKLNEINKMKLVKCKISRKLKTVNTMLQASISKSCTSICILCQKSYKPKLRLRKNSIKFI